jgi:hypothetical protein
LTPSAPLPPPQEVLDLTAMGSAAFGRALLRVLRQPAFWGVVVLVGLAVWRLFFFN